MEMKLVQEKKRREDLTTYLNHPLNREQISDAQKSSRIERLDLLTNSETLAHSSNLREFIERIFPDVFEGSVEAKKLVSKWTHDPVTDMSALYFIDRCRDWWDALTEEDLNTFDNWIEKNHVLR